MGYAVEANGQRTNMNEKTEAEARRRAVSMLTDADAQNRRERQDALHTVSGGVLVDRHAKYPGGSRRGCDMNRENPPRPVDAELLRVIRCAQTYREKYISVARLEDPAHLAQIALDAGLNWKVRKAAICRLQDRETLARIAENDPHDYLRSMAKRRLTGEKHPPRVSRYSAKDAHYDWKYPVFFKTVFCDPYNDEVLCRIEGISRNLVWLYGGGTRNRRSSIVKRYSFLFTLYEETLPEGIGKTILASLEEDGGFAVELGARRFWGKPVVHHEWKLRLHAEQYGFSDQNFTCRRADFIAAVERDLP